jgi:hypothetical protein
MNVSAEEISAAVKDDTSPHSCGDALPSPAEANGSPAESPSPAADTSE